MFVLGWVRVDHLATNSRLRVNLLGLLHLDVAAFVHLLELVIFVQGHHDLALDPFSFHWHRLGRPLQKMDQSAFALYTKLVGIGDLLEMKGTAFNFSSH